MVIFVALYVYKQFLVKRSHGHERDPGFWMYMFFFGSSVGLCNGFSALSIAAQDISMKEIIEASQPIFTLCTFVFYERQKVTTVQLIGIFMTVFGVLCSVFETPDLAINGAIYSLIIVISNAFVSSLSTQIKIFAHDVFVHVYDHDHIFHLSVRGRGVW
jgi:drug/metabolite transporter (DMT)-like permease